MPLPLRQLEAFHAVVANGNMTKAAKFLEISQPAVSRLVATLEESLGFPLFQRLSGRLRPTPEARVIFDEVEKALANLNHISRLTENIQDKKTGHLRVACLPGFATSLLPRVLARFLNERPGLTLTLEPRAPERIQEWISAQQFDVGISEQFEDNPSIESEAIQIRTVFVAPEGHPLAKKKFVTPKDLDGLPMIHNNRDHAIFGALQQAFNSAGAELNGVVESRQFAPACIMVVEGYGVSVVSEIDAREYENEGLVIRPFKPNIPFQINILYPAFMPRSLATIEFVEAFKKSLEPFRL
ncbi:MAG: LysR family transcriptional regulator [Rhodospirillaceae bacterium]|jgi:DNA-binding transcriptional LysR family regulator|nr:LysR family transcriptional regulator [Rhodospirillaceae bacterium]MBT5245248.1 LysR family transcriptional regulator [Rhodospirillaceae bacterium]MBT5562779.1 LysR family transcriptional regulator [Rhodospirillaceae bacterium]MBT6240708.1 LysR family transcriptional regulator [Rhodospirillaceae bacterium]